MEKRRWFSWLFFAVGLLALLVGCSSGGDSGGFAIAFPSDSWVYKGVSMNENDPTLRHYVWEMPREPFGPWDKIQLHRYVKETSNPDCIPGRAPANSNKVLFFNPGTWDRAIHATQDMKSQQWYFAANDYDFYAIDFRTAFLPYNDYDQFVALGLADELAGTTDWTYAVFREDIKACVEKAKDISGASRLFMSGFSRGTFHVTAYSAKYPGDLKGMILLDGSGLWRNADNTDTQKSEVQLNAAVAMFKAGTLPTLPELLSDGGGNERTRFGAMYPHSRNTVTRAPENTVNNLETDVNLIKTATGATEDIPGAPESISDVLAYAYYWTWGRGKLTNVYGGFSTIDVLLKYQSQLSRYWPNIQNLEASFLTGYANCPFLDYHDNAEVTVPVLFIGGELGCPGGVCNMPPPFSSYSAYMTATEDRTIRYLADYGHVDILIGDDSVNTVKSVELDWMNDRL